MMKRVLLLRSMALAVLASPAMAGNLVVKQLKLGTWVGDSTFVARAEGGPAGSMQYTVSGLIARDTTEAINVSDYCVTCWPGNLATTLGYFKVVIACEEAATSADTVYVGFDSSVDGRIWSSLPDNATAFNPIVASATGKMFHTSGLSGWNVSQGGSPGPAFVGNYLRVRIMLDNATSSTLPRAKVYIVYPAVLGGDR